MAMSFQSGARRALRQAFVSTRQHLHHHQTTPKRTSPTSPLSSSSSSPPPLRLFATSPRFLKDDEISGKEGQYARTDHTIQVSYPGPSSSQLPPSDTLVKGIGHGGVPTLPTFSLQGKVGVVTGGARGLGLVMGQGMVISGADLAIVDLNKEEAEKQAKLIVETFKRDNPSAERLPRITAHYADVSDPESVASCVSDIVSAHGKIDSLVTSAGFTENFEAVSYPFDRVQKLWGVNVDGTWLFATEIAKHLIERKARGSMVFIGSMSGSIVNVPQPQAPYNAAKAAVRHMASSLAVEWAKHGVRVNVISPGYMLTALTQKILDDNPDLKEKWTSLIPQGKMGKPEDLMGPVTFLLSDASSYVTGADLRVDGGYTCT
ncbi:putative D-arabinitol 2-dehydrogenase [Triangularia setosa]|uniref:D-arabinitol 2-dehydrogenase n=1 Tax=Triangularia setosa TaxID=2587417 RepID=A0AAN6W652_9PEZI|nr:putative D-arabinitol 2-dehydrogenase [Podospora setosa]